MNKSARVSEILLVVVLLVIVGLTRVYYGAPSGAPMAVWKGEFSLNDTLVNVPEMAALPRAELEQNHRDTLFQMEEMGLLAGPSDMQIPPKNKKPL